MADQEALGDILPEGPEALAHALTQDPNVIYLPGRPEDVAVLTEAPASSPFTAGSAVAVTVHQTYSADVPPDTLQVVQFPAALDQTPPLAPPPVHAWVPMSGMVDPRGLAVLDLSD